MAQAEFHEVMSVDKDKLMAVITRFEDYPKFVEGCTQAKVESQNGDKSRVKYGASVMGKDMSYTLDHAQDTAAGRLDWTLVESEFFKKNVGRWELKAAGAGKTDVLYAVELDFKIPVPGFILNRMIKSQLPELVKSFVKRANQT